MRTSIARGPLARAILQLAAMACALASLPSQAANPADWKNFTSTTKRNWSDATSWTDATGVPTTGASLVVNIDPFRPGTVTSSGKIGQSFDATNDLGTVQLDTLNLAGESNGSGRTIRFYDGTLRFSGDNASINDTTAGADASIKYQFYGSLLMDAQLGLNLNGTGELTLLGASGNTLSANAAGLHTLTVSGPGKCNLGASSGAVIADGAGQVGITMTGTGTLTIGGQNTFTGDLRVRSGMVQVNGSSAGTSTSYGNGAIYLGDTSGTADATLSVKSLASSGTYGSNSGLVVQSGSTGTKTLLNVAGNSQITIGWPITLDDDLTVNYTSVSGGSTTLGSTTAGEWIVGSKDLIFYSNGTLFNSSYISGTNPNFTGDVFVQSGGFAVKSAAALSAANGVTVASGASFDIRGVDQTIAGLAGEGIVTNTGVAKILTLAGSGAHSFGGSIGATTPANLALTVAMTGGGTQVLGGGCTYTGATMVNDGTLLVDGSLAAGSAVTVGINGTLGGTGTVNGATTVNGSLAPAGTGIGTLAFGGNVVLSANAAYQWGYQAGTGDSVTVAGNLQLPASATVAVAEGAGARPDPCVLFEAGTLSGTTDLSGWEVTPEGYSVVVEGTSVLLLPPPDSRTMILIR